jgi:hypothetical protein
LIGLVPLCYLGIYVALSLSGAYRDNVSVVDEISQPCLCASDKYQWQPAQVAAVYMTISPGERNVFFANSLGVMFRPLVMLDQRYWHPDRPIPEIADPPCDQIVDLHQWPTRCLVNSDVVACSQVAEAVRAIPVPAACAIYVRLWKGETVDDLMRLTRELSNLGRTGRIEFEPHDWKPLDRK